MAVDRCADCQTSLGTMTQEVLPGVNVSKRCPACERNVLVKHWLTMLPLDDGDDWHTLTEWEQEFVRSVRQQYARKGSVSEKQYAIIERIYAKH